MVGDYISQSTDGFGRLTIETGSPTTRSHATGGAERGNRSGDLRTRELQRYESCAPLSVPRALALVAVSSAALWGLIIALVIWL
jgi:hypothetical protein